MIDSLGLEKDLYVVIIEKYKQGNYTDSIKDAFLHLTEYLQNESGLMNDGVDLVGDALNMKETNPRIVLNKLSNKTERGIQEGVQAILRGMYQALRNPRSHMKHNDSESEAIRIILMIDYMIKTIRASKKDSVLKEFVTKRIFDEYFAETKDYAQRVTGEISSENRLKVFYEVFTRRNEGSEGKIKLFFFSLYSAMEEPELTEIMNMFGEKLLTCGRDDIIDYIKYISPNLWFRLPSNSKIRIEEMMLESLSKGTLETDEGDLGKWSFTFGYYFESKDRLLEKIVNRLSETRNSRMYIAPNIQRITQIFDYKDHIKELSRGFVQAALTKNDQVFGHFLIRHMNNMPIIWKESLGESLQNNTDDSNRNWTEELLEKLK